MEAPSSMMMMEYSVLHKRYREHYLTSTPPCPHPTSSSLQWVVPAEPASSLARTTSAAPPLRSV